jgi:hypothetical protein
MIDNSGLGLSSTYNLNEVIANDTVNKLDEMQANGEDPRYIAEIFKSLPEGVKASVSNIKRNRLVDAGKKTKSKYVKDPNNITKIAANIVSSLQ